MIELRSESLSSAMHSSFSSPKVSADMIIYYEVNDTDVLNLAPVVSNEFVTDQGSQQYHDLTIDHLHSIRLMAIHE